MTSEQVLCDNQFVEKKEELKHVETVIKQGYNNLIHFGYSFRLSKDGMENVVDSSLSKSIHHVQLKPVFNNSRFVTALFDSSEGKSVIEMALEVVGCDYMEPKARYIISPEPKLYKII